MEIKTASQMASIYGMKSSIAFNKMLVKCGLLVKTDKGYVLSKPMQGWGFTTVIEVPYFLPNGFRATKKKAAWTESGQHFIRQHLGRIGILPISEQRDMFTTN
jgi:hypothetical protein